MNHKQIKLRIKEILISLAIGIIYYLSNNRPLTVFDHTFKIAKCILNGSLGLTENDRPQINEFIPLDSRYYSAFPLGSVLSMIPIAIIKSWNLIGGFPAKSLSSLIVFCCAIFMFLISSHYKLTSFKRGLLTCAILLGTWNWVNQTFAGSWQLALAFSMLGQLGCIYFSVFNQRPFLAGLFFSLAFGNRTECILLVPIFLYLIANRPKTCSALLRKNTILFCIFPMLVGIATLWYNYARFGSVFEFGYSRIPGVLDEPWYNYGIFSVHYIKDQLWEMLLKPWNAIPYFPFYTPNVFGNSILISSPFILLILRSDYQDKTLKFLSYLSILFISLPLIMHGNSGGWQFAYRYATTFLPWIYIGLLETNGNKTSIPEMVIYAYCFILNAYALYFFHWSA